MIQQTVEAVFENGVFRLMTPIDIAIPEGQQVRLIIEVAESSTDMLALALNIYAGLAEEQIDEIEQIVLDRSNFFSERTL